MKQVIYYLFITNGMCLICCFVIKKIIEFVIFRLPSPKYGWSEIKTKPTQTKKTKKTTTKIKQQKQQKLK